MKLRLIIPFIIFFPFFTNAQENLHLLDKFSKDSLNVVSILHEKYIPKEIKKGIDSLFKKNVEDYYSYLLEKSKKTRKKNYSRRRISYVFQYQDSYLFAYTHSGRSGDIHLILIENNQFYFFRINGEAGFFTKENTLQKMLKNKSYHEFTDHI